ncbi:hypothetical protein ACSBR2_020751 [Camellia fascicularis]
MPLEDNPLGLGWITNSKEVINEEVIKPPLLPLFDPPMKLVILTETRVGGTRCKALSENLSFSNVHIFYTIGFAKGIWLLWNDLEIDCEVLLTTE